MRMVWVRMVWVFLMVGFAGACGTDEAESSEGYDFGVEVDEFGKPNLLETGYQDSSDKSDAASGKPGLLTTAGANDTAVWEIKNQWFDKDTAAAKKSGLAWGENSGLTWEEKYSKWVSELPKTENLTGYGSNPETFLLTTPWGTQIAAPALECAEVAMFLRITFASWHNLPFFMEATDGRGKRLYFGHFGIRTENGVYENMPNFKTRYKDYSSQMDAVRAGTAAFPTDSVLAGRKLAGGTDDYQPMIGPDAHAGAYFDKVFLNKRVGYYLLIHLSYLGSTNLADASNLYNIEAAAVRGGDVLVERWQQRGIGHVLAVMNSRKLGEQEIDGQTFPILEAELASGSMPRRQPLWENPNSAKRYFTMDETGGPEYVQFGGGLKRWRAAVAIGGRWTNMVLDEDFDVFIPTTNKDKLAARPLLFESLLKTLTPEEKLTSLAEVIEAKRAHLRNYPASCSARINRELAFDDLYEVGEELGISRLEIDQRYRTFEDYVFAELVYEKSKTCCWNRSTANMYDIAMQYNERMLNDEENRQCGEVTVFMNRDDSGDGYELFRQFAIELGRGAEWVNWTADESCPQADVAEDTQAEHVWTDLCEVEAGFAL